MEKRYIGIDLHRNGFTCCLRLENGRSYLSQWRLEDLPRFVKKLRASDELAMEITGNARLLYDAVARQVARVYEQQEEGNEDDVVAVIRRAFDNEMNGPAATEGEIGPTS